MTDLFCTLGFSSNATDEERAEQSNERIAVATELARRIDKIKHNSLENVLNELVKYFKNKENMKYDENFLEKNIKLRKFVEETLQASIQEQQMAELKTKLLFLIYKQINYCFDTFSSIVEKNSLIIQKNH